MRGRILISVGTLLVVAMVYEVTFRHVTASYGLVDMQANPPHAFITPRIRGPGFPGEARFMGVGCNYLSERSGSGQSIFTSVEAGSIATCLMAAGRI
jgi:hypothetical protein